jgi:dihydroorotate dehydrogenase electron transfer subunit
MSNSLHASFYPDSACQQTVEVVQNQQLARDTCRLRFACPPIAERIRPGQFLMLRLAGWDDPLIGRPMALYDVIANGHGRPTWIDVVYLVKGKFTQRLARCHGGEALDVWGPLGNGFSTEPVAHLVMVAGGIGQTPFLALGKQFLGQQQYGAPPAGAARARQVTLCYGARSADLLAGIDDFEQAGIELLLATDDGSRGHRGLVTDLLCRVLETTTQQPRIACCGPEVMMEAVSAIAVEKAVPCEVSLETPMACGIGLCFSCVAKVRDTQGDWDYKRTCVEGPVFDARQIVW